MLRASPLPGSPHTCCPLSRAGAHTSKSRVWRGCSLNFDKIQRGRQSLSRPSSQPCHSVGRAVYPQRRLLQDRNFGLSRRLNSCRPATAASPVVARAGDGAPGASRRGLFDGLRRVQSRFGFEASDQRTQEHPQWNCARVVELHYQHPIIPINDAYFSGSIAMQYHIFDYQSDTSHLAS